MSKNSSFATCGMLPLPMGRVSSSPRIASRNLAHRSRVMPSGSWVKSFLSPAQPPISLPIDHTITDGWFLSRRTNSRRFRSMYGSSGSSGSLLAVSSHLSKHSSHTSKPSSSQRSSVSGATGLWLVRSAFAPMSFISKSWRRTAERQYARPRSPMSSWRFTPFSCTRRPLR